MPPIHRCHPVDGCRLSIDVVILTLSKAEGEESLHLFWHSFISNRMPSLDKLLPQTPLAHDKISSRIEIPLLNQYFATNRSIKSALHTTSPTLTNLFRILCTNIERVGPPLLHSARETPHPSRRTPVRPQRPSATTRRHHLPPWQHSHRRPSPSQRPLRHSRQGRRPRHLRRKNHLRRH